MQYGGGLPLELPLPFHGGPLPTPVVRTTETEEALPITAPTIKLLGQASETDTAQPVSILKTQPVGQATEANTANEIRPTELGSVGQASETNTAQAVSSLKTQSVGQATEGDASQTVRPERTIPVGQAQYLFGYLDLPGSVGDLVSTPDSTALSITGDIDLRAAVALDDWTPGANEVLLAKGSQSTGDYQFVVLTTGILRLGWHDGSSFNTEDSTEAPAVADGDLLLVRVTMDVDDGGGNRVVNFYTKTSTPSNAATDLADETNWTQLGPTVTTASTTSIRDSTDNLVIGATGAEGANITGECYASIVKDGIDGTTVASPDFTSVESGSTSFTDDQGNTWSVEGDAEIVGASQANPLDILKTQPIGQATEADTGLSLSPARTLQLGIARENHGANSIFTKLHILGVAESVLESDRAFAILALRHSGRIPNASAEIDVQGVSGEATPEEVSASVEASVVEA